MIHEPVREMRTGKNIAMRICRDLINWNWNAYIRKPGKYLFVSTIASFKHPAKKTPQAFV